MLAGRFTFGSQTLTVPDGFVVERVADAPLVNRPIEMDFDSQGRLWFVGAFEESDPARAAHPESSQRPYSLGLGCYLPRN